MRMSLDLTGQPLQRGLSAALKCAAGSLHDGSQWHRQQHLVGNSTSARRLPSCKAQTVARPSEQGSKGRPCSGWQPMQDMAVEVDTDMQLMVRPAPASLFGTHDGLIRTSVT